MSTPITPVILAGGGGTRLWPLSRVARPKPFLRIAGEDSMLEATLARAAGDGFEAPLLVGSEAHSSALADAAGPEATLILEPEGRNTAPAIALAAHALAREAVMLVMPSDHIIRDAEAFREAVRSAAALAEEGWLVALGIAPSGPETGYGYIEAGDALGEHGFRAARFVEKPDAAAAEAMLAKGGHWWNGGIFVFRAGDFIDALDQHGHEIEIAARHAMARATHAERTIRPDAEAFAEAPAISVDYAVMEKVSRVAVVPVEMGWSDAGSWDALHEIAARDDAGNALIGDILAIDSRDSLIRSDGPLVAAIGVSDLLVVATGDAVLIVPRGESQRVREAVEALAQDPDRKEKL